MYFFVHYLCMYIQFGNVCVCVPLQDYVVHQILHAPEDEQDLEPSSEEEALQMAERLNDRRVQLAAFLKLAMFRVIDMMKVAPIWAEYIRVSPPNAHHILLN